MKTTKFISACIIVMLMLCSCSQVTENDKNSANNDAVPSEAATAAADSEEESAEEVNEPQNAEHELYIPDEPIDFGELLYSDMERSDFDKLKIGLNTSADKDVEDEKLSDAVYELVTQQLGTGNSFDINDADSFNYGVRGHTIYIGSRNNRLDVTYYNHGFNVCYKGQYFLVSDEVTENIMDMVDELIE